MTNPSIKGALHGIVSIFGNGVIFELVPAPYKVWALLVFNIIQVIYAYIDPTYTVHLLGKAKQGQA